MSAAQKSVVHPVQAEAALRPQKRRAPVAGQALALSLDRSPHAPPLYRQIRDSVRSAVLSGALGAGMRLPPERELAAALGVNRTTIMRAYQELAADGVVEASPGRGTIIRAPARPSDGNGAAWGAGTWPAAPGSSWLLGLPAVGQGLLDPGLLRDVAALSARDDLISFAAGAPAPDLIPLDDLQAALNQGLERASAAGLGYGPVEGLEALRLALAARLGGRGVAVAPDEILVLAGATQGLALAARALVEPGDEVVVEAPTYVGILQTFGAAGARLIGVPCDRDGLRVDLLAPVLARRRVRLIVLQPTLHNPTGATLTPERRERLLALAGRYGVPILEDDTYGELWHEGHEGPDPGPLKRLDRSGLVLHLGSFSKTLAPGLRIGWLAAPAPVVARLALAKQLLDLNTGTLGQLALIELLAAGGYDRHLARVRATYAERRCAMLAALQPAAPYLRVPQGPHGGFYLWCRLTAGRRARLLAAAAGRAGVALLAGEAFFPPGATGPEDGADRIRLSFSGVAPAAITEGVSRLLPVLQRLPEMSAAEGHVRGLRPVV